MKKLFLIFIGCSFFFFVRSQQNNTGSLAIPPYDWHLFVMGSDLSYVNQIEDAGGTYKVDGIPKDPFSIFKQIGNNTVRVRLWHNPQWELPITKGKLYSDIYDVEKTIRRAKQAGMAINLDLHYSDDWSDPNQQPTPDAWKNLPISTLKDTVYNYTLNVLNYLRSKDLVPEMVQVGNENNFGMLWPVGKVDTSKKDNQWTNFGILLNSGIKAVRDFSKTSPIKPQIILHVAQLQFANWWATNIAEKGGVSDYDILGLSHYYKWSTVNNMQAIGDTIRLLRNRFHKKIMIVETAFPFTNENADGYSNLFYSTTPIAGYSFTQADQQRYMKDLIQQVISNGGSGIMYWEPAWITSPMKDRWGKGSSWENNAFFDFSGNLLPNMDFMKYPYHF